MGFVCLSFHSVWQLIWRLLQKCYKLHVQYFKTMCTVDVQTRRTVLFLCYLNSEVSISHFPAAIPVFESSPSLSPLYQLIVQSQLQLLEEGSAPPPPPRNMHFYSVSRHTIFCTVLTYLIYCESLQSFFNLFPQQIILTRSYCTGFKAMTFWNYTMTPLYVFLLS